MNSDDYLTIAEPGHAQTRVLGSRFMGAALPLSGVEEIDSLLELERKHYHDATHWCFAARAGVAPNLLERASDAGEPKGTAGMPILQQIQGRHLTNSLVIVTRYFGGTKLGTGNLARAYADCAALALDAAATARRVILKSLVVECSYDLQSLVYHVAQRFEAAVEPLASVALARFRLSAPQSRFDALSAALIEESRGRIHIEASPS